MDWCRSESLKLASCSDDETVRVWTLDPLLVAHCKSSPAAPHCQRNLGHHRVAAAPGQAVAGATEDTVAEGGSQSGGASGRGSVSGASLDGGIGDDGAIQGKFGRGVACIGESEWWRRRKSCGASRPTGVAGDTLSRCTRGTVRGSSGGEQRSADFMDVCASLTPASSDALLGVPEVAGTAGSCAASGTSGKAAAWRGSSASVLDESLATVASATVASATAAFGGERSSVALDFFPMAGSGSAQVFSPCSPNKKAGARTQARAEGGAAAGGDVADVGIVLRDAGRRDGANGANSNENAAPPLLGDAWTDPPSSASAISSRSRDARPPAAESKAPSRAGASVKHPRGTSERDITTVEASMFRKQSVLAPPSGIGGGAKPTGLDFLRGLPSSARAVGSGWHGRGGSREWRRQQQQEQQQEQPQPQLQQRRRQSLRLVSRRRISYVEAAPLRTQHPTLMTFWNGAQAQGGSSSEASGKAQGGGDRMAAST